VEVKSLKNLKLHVKRRDAQSSWGRNQVRKVLLCVRSKERKCSWEVLVMVAYENGPWGLNLLRRTFNGFNQVRLGLWCVWIKWHAFQMRNKHYIAWNPNPCPLKVKKVWIVEAWFNIIYWLISKPKLNVVIRIAKCDLKCKSRRQRKPLSLIPCVRIAQRKIT
jgi:hypothetical protein